MKGGGDMQAQTGKEKRKPGRPKKEKESEELQKLRELLTRHKNEDGIKDLTGYNAILHEVMGGEYEDIIVYYDPRR